ncbi:MAG: alpha/beta fold hydrolase [Chloroflexi bacterium]|nr:alpha/beta fold hydrolase [Chloroflexota bacterium]
MPLIGPPGERIGYVIHEGPPGAPPIFLLHGFTASAASFSGNIAGLSRHFRVVTVDLLGHGESDSPEDAAPYAPGPAMDRLEALFDHLGYDRVLLCGHSLGGALALRFAIERPDRLEGLIVINSSSASGTPAWRATVGPRMAEMGARVRAEGTDFLRRGSTYPAASRRLPPLARDQLAGDFDRLEWAGVAGTAEALIPNVNVFERIPELAVPTLLVFGDRDADVMSFAEGFIDAVPEEVRRVVTIPGAGHAANLERPDVFDAAVVGFAREIGYLPPDEPGGVIGSFRRSMLAVVGGLLVAGGVALVAAAFFLGGDDGNASAAREATATATATAVPPTRRPVSSVSPVSTVAGAQVSATASAATTTPVATSRPAAAPADTPAATSTTAPPAPTPTATATQPPAATATPSGPYVKLSGPSSAAAGAVMIFSASASAPAPAELLTYDWSFSAGGVRSGGIVQSALQVRFDTPDCYTVTVTAYFTGGATATASQNISVGGASCGLG